MQSSVKKFKNLNKSDIIKADNGSGKNGVLLDNKLLDELASSGVKYNPNDVVLVTKTGKTGEGQLLWLEKGNSSAGLEHILIRHAKNLVDKGVDNIPETLNSVLKTNPIDMGSNSRGLFADYVFNGSVYRVAYGTNGFIVSFYPMRPND